MSPERAGEPAVRWADLRAWWVAASLLLLAGLALHLSPLNAQWMIRLHRLSEPQALAMFWSSFTVLGLGLSTLVVVAALDRGSGRLLLALIPLFLLASLATHLPKALIDSPRPAAVLVGGELMVVGDALKGRGSLPSGHAIAAGAAAMFLGLWLPWAQARRWLAVIVGAAALVAWSRIAVAAHWPADVLAGIGIGMLATLAVAAAARHCRWQQLTASPGYRRAGGLLARARLPLFITLELGLAIAFLSTSTGYPQGWPAVWGLAAVAVCSAWARAWAAAGRNLPTARDWIRLAVGLTVVLLAWHWLLRHADFAALSSRLGTVPVWAWPLAGVMLLGGHGLRALRLRQEWQAHRQVGWWPSLRLVLLHNAAVLMLPLRSGEAAYPWLVQRQWGVHWRDASACLAWWRIQDLAVLVILALLLLPPWPLAARVLLATSLVVAAWPFAPALQRVVLRLVSGRHGLPIRPWAGLPASAGNWSLKVLANGGLLLLLAGLDAQTALRAALGGELAGVQPVQGPAGLGTYEAGVWLASRLPSSAQADLVAAALAVHAFSLAIALGAAALSYLIIKPPPAVTLEPAMTDADPPVSTADAPGAADFEAPAHRLSLVVPMYNEIDNAAPLIDSVQAALASYPHPWELIVVDDGSTDGTAAALRRHAQTVGGHVQVLCLARNFRQTAAMQAGIDAARGDVIVTMDGDLQNDPRDIPRMVARLLNEDLDLVAGWRRERQDGLLLRRVPSMLANRLIRRVSGLAFHDLGCSLKVFRGDVLRQIRLYGEMHRFIPAWLATVTSPSRMAEEPVNHHARQAGESKYGITRTFRVLVDLLSVHFFLRFGSRPGHFFGGIGLAILGVGMVMLTYLLGLKLLGESVGSRPLLFLGFFLVMGGLQFLTTGVIAELLIRMYYDGDRASAYHLRGDSDRAPDEGWHG